MRSNKSFLLISYPKFVGMLSSLCLKIFKNRNHEAFDYIISIQRGGAVMSKIISDLINIPIGTLTIRSYKGMKRSKTTKITQALSCDITGKRVLVLDEISETGKTLMYVKEYLNKFSPSEVVFATLFIKPKTKFIPDFYTESTSKWIVFPYELQEMLELIGNNKVDEKKLRIYKNYLTSNGTSESVLKKIIELSSNK